MKKTVVATLLLIGLMVLSVVCIQPIKAEYQGNIIINADGSVTPSTAPIRQTGSLYTLTEDLDGSLTVNRNDTMLDGNGHTVVSHNYTSYGRLSLSRVSNVTVKNFVIPYEGRYNEQIIGISLNDATRVKVANNTITGFWSIQALNGILFAGIYVVGGSSNTFTHNSLLYNLDGIEFVNTSHNLIVENSITSNPVWSPYTTGISFIGASDNAVYRNNFVNCTYLVKVSDSVNSWDDGFLGNYWSNYKTKYPTAIQIGNSGVNNVPYVINEQNTDRYPLTRPFTSEFYEPKVPPKVAIQSPANQQFNESSVPLVFTVDKQVNWMGYSLDGKDNVTVTGNTTITELTNGSHNVTIYAEDIFGNEGGSETVAFTVAFEAFPTVPVLVASATTVAVVCVAVLVYLKKRRATP